MGGDEEGRDRPFFVSRRSRRDGLVVEIGGECDAATVDELNDGLRDAVDESPAQLTVDLEQATFVESDARVADGCCARTPHCRGVFRVMVRMRRRSAALARSRALDRFLLRAGA
jgi:hypothetical protein